MSVTRVATPGPPTMIQPSASRASASAPWKTTLTIGAIEVRDYDGPRESLVSYPDPAVRIEGSRTSYLHTDHLGSLRAASDAAGTRMELRSYRGYGEMTRYSDDLPQEDHAWIGERRDAGAELMYVNAR